MTQNYLDILEDLRESTSNTIFPYPLPYNEQNTLQQKLMAIQRSIRRAKRLCNRVLILVNTFYLEKLLELEVDPFQRVNSLTMLSSYYLLVSVRLYYLFEYLGVEQIMKTHKTTLTKIKRLSNREFLELVNKVLDIFSSAENVEEDDVENN